MNKYKKHIFICENIREGENSLQSCGKIGGTEIRDKLKNRLRELGISSKVRANSAGCLGACNYGPIMVVYPEGTWYGELSVNDIEEIIQKDIVENKKVEKLELKV